MAAESDRLDALFRYFRSAQDVLDANIDAPTGYNPNSARLSSDPVLNALAQLGVHRLKCNRAFVSLVDGQHEYIIAEVTESISLFDASHHVDGEQIAIGVRALDLASGVCAGTISAFTDPSGSHQVMSDNMTTDATSFVVKDLTLEPKYKSRPYVTNYPFMRFYAGVPIRTESGHVIGTFAVVDNKPRMGLSKEGLRNLTEISSSVMKHLHLLQAQSSRDSAFRAFESIKSLVEDTGTLTGASNELNTREPFIVYGTTLLSIPDSNTTNLNHQCEAENRFPLHSAIQSSLERTSDPMLQDIFVGKSRRSRLHTATPSVTTSARSSKTIDQDCSTSKVGEQSLPHSITKLRSSQETTLLLRSAKQIKRAIQMTRVLFVPEILPLENKMEGVPIDGCVCDDHAEVSFAQDLHKKLLAYSSNGYYLNLFDRKTSLSQNCFLQQPERDCSFAAGPEATTNLASSLSMKEALVRALRTALPLAKSIMWLPLFSPEHRDCPWTIFTWSCEDRRILQQEDLSHLSLFGFVIQAEFSRLKSVAQNRAKSDFISSVSHELRSPLHGVLGNTELLLESSLDSERQQMVLMVEKCARSLLITVDHILAYSKINNTRHGGQAHSLSDSDEVRNLTAVDLSTVVEDSVAIAMTGDRYRSFIPIPQSSKSHGSANTSIQEGTGMKTSDARALRLNLYIDYSLSCTVFTEAAVWDRCVSNLLGNALKYTRHGEIQVKLESGPILTSPSSEDDRRLIKLSVIDTGRGISPQYLQEHLYKPFLQENTNSDGLGLGLSITKKMVESMNGTIDIQSSVNKGTKVEIVVSLRVQPLTNNTNEQTLYFRGRKVCLWLESAAAVESLSSPLFIDQSRSLIPTLIQYCISWCNLDVSYYTKASSANSDVLIILKERSDTFESSSPRCPEFQSLSGQCAVVVIDNTPLRDSKSVYPEVVGVFRVQPPFGPKRLTAVLGQAFEYADKVKSGVRASMDYEYRAAQASVQKRDRSCTGTSSVSQIVQDNHFGAANSPMERQGTQSSRAVTQISKAARPNSQSLADIQPDSVAPGCQRKGLHVLVVDDNEINVKLLGKVLERRGITYETAYDGSEAVEIFTGTEKAFDCVLMDISMPVMNGIEATRAIRLWEAAETSHSRSRIVALTGLGDQHIRREALASGVDAFVTKPFRLGEIETWLQVSK